MFNNIPPSGFPQIDLSQDVKRINAEISGMTSDCTNIITDITAETATVTGNPISLSDALATDAISVVAEIEPEQDLHGYGKPWAAGAGKNLVSPSVTESNARVSSVTYILGDDEITLTTAASTNYMCYGIFYEFAAGTYTIKYQATSSDSYTPSVTIYNENNAVVASGIRPDTAVTFTLNEDCKIEFRMFASGSGDGVVGRVVKYYEMQVESGSSATEWTPYTNICPISGMDSVTVTTTDGTDTTTATASLGTTIYGGSVDMTEGSASVTMANIASYDGETIGEPWLSSMDEYVSGATPTTGAQVVYTLATPTTLSLTPTTLAMLEGENTVSTDAEEVSIEYIKNTLVGRVRRLEEEQ